MISLPYSTGIPFGDDVNDDGFDERVFVDIDPVHHC
jgi:hypothetical protein